jgi:hypothetical protein
MWFMSCQICSSREERKVSFACIILRLRVKTENVILCEDEKENVSREFMFYVFHNFQINIPTTKTINCVKTITTQQHCL